MKKTAKFLSILMAIEMIFATAAVGVFALDTTPAADPDQTVAEEVVVAEDAVVEEAAEELEAVESEALNAEEGEEAKVTPATPALAGAYPDYHSVTVIWSPAANAASYIVARSDGASWPTTGTSYRDTAAAKDVSYQYCVIAVSSDGTQSAPSAWSAPAGRVRTAYYYCTLKAGVTLKSHDKAKAKINLKKGEVIQAEGFSQGSFKFERNGRPYEAKWFRMKKVKGQISKNAYANGITATNYVNNGGFASPTPYLIWINIYSQRVFVFTGSAGNWTLVNRDAAGADGWLCGTGKAKFPTPTGMNKSLHKKMKKYSKHKWWNCFSGTNAIHGSNGKKELKKLGKLISNGCVRVTNDQAIWIFNNVPKKTRVIVF